MNAERYTRDDSMDEAMKLTIDMFDAADVPQNVRREYFELFNIFITGG